MTNTWGELSGREPQDAGTIDVLRVFHGNTGRERLDALSGTRYPLTALLRQARVELARYDKPVRGAIRGLGYIVLDEEGWEFTPDKKAGRE